MTGQIAIPWRTIRYSIDNYPFPSLVARDVCPGEPADALVRLGGLAGPTARWTQRTDQVSVWHQRFYAGFPRWREVYDAFVAAHIAPLFDEPFYYQHVPTFRVHLPDNVAVGEFHTDAQYHHPVGETTFWLALTPAYDTNSVWIEPDSGQAAAVTIQPGEVAVFDAVRRRHGNQVNQTRRTRVSFDFRCVPVHFLDGSEGRSVNAGLRFAPGEYYHRDPVAGTAGAVR